MPQNEKNIFQDGRSGQRSSVFWCLLGLGLICVDQGVKFLVYSHDWPKPSNPWIGLAKFKNDQFAFSIHLPAPVIFFIYAIVLFFLLAYVAKHRACFGRQQWLAWTLIFAGSASNIIERIALGYVRDFLYFWGGGIFNLADLYIMLGILILILGKREK